MRSRLPFMHNGSLPNDVLFLEKESKMKRQRRYRWMVARVCTLLWALLIGAVNVWILPKNGIPMTTKPSFPFDAIVTLATNGYSANHLINSLRTSGNWSKAIYCLTDEPNNVNESQAIAVNISSSHPDHLTDDKRQKWESWKKSAGKNGIKMWSQWQKTQLFRLLPSDINTILFVDADVEVNRPLDVFEVEAQVALADDCVASHFQERWWTKVEGISSVTIGGDWNTGISIYRRTQSHDMLKIWGDSFVDHEPFMVRDQPLLMEMLGRHPEMKICALPFKGHMRYEASVLNIPLDIVTFGRYPRSFTFRHFTAWKSLKAMEKAN